MRIVARKASSLFSGGARQGARIEGGVSPVKHHPLDRPVFVDDRPGVIERVTV